jgi:hypothetical protein
MRPYTDIQPYTTQRSAADSENITHSRRLPSVDQTARRSAAAIKKSSQVPHAAPAPVPIPATVPVPAPAPPTGSYVKRSQGKASAEELMASAADPFTYAEPMESPQ